MDALLGLLLAALGLLTVAAPVLALVAFLRTREVGALRARIELLEAKLGRLLEGQEVGPIQERPAAVEGPEPVDRPAPTPPEPVAIDEPATREVARPETAVAEAALEELRRPEPHSEQGAPASRIDWERWLGVHGAAIAGGVSLVLGGLFFFQYAIAHGWFSPGLRIVLGTLVGLGCTLAKGGLHRRGYAILSDVLAGAGAVLLYGAAWASYRLYGFVPVAAAFAWMSAVTVLAGVLAVRYRAQVIALFGLVGGFATPILLATGESGPMSLFGYVLLLDLGLLAIGRRLGWPLLGLLGLAGTALMQAIWILGAMGADQAPVGLGVLAVFALLFAASGSGLERARRGGWIASQVSGLVLPFLFALHFATQVDLGGHLWPLGLLLGLLCGTAAWIGGRNERPELASGAAAGAVAVSLAWAVSHFSHPGLWWELAGVGAGLAAAMGALGWLRRSDEERAWYEHAMAPAATLALGTILALLVMTSSAAELSRLPFTPLAVACAVLGAIALAAAWDGVLRWLPELTAGAVGGVLAAYGAFYSRAGWPRAGWVDSIGAQPYLLVAAVFAAALLALGAWRRGAAIGRHLLLAAAVLALPVILALAPWSEPDPIVYLGGVALLAGLAAAGASEARSATAYGAVALGAVIALTRWNVELIGGEQRHELVPASLAVQAALAAWLTWLPTLGGLGRTTPAASRLRRVAALVPAAWATPVNLLAYERIAERPVLWLLLLGLAVLAGVGAARVLAVLRQSSGGREDLRRDAGCYGAVATALAAFAVARWIHVEWIAIGTALAGLAWVAVARAAQSRPLRFAGQTALVAAGGALLVLALVPGHFARSEALVFNRLAFVYAAVAGALLGGLYFSRREAGASGGERTPADLLSLGLTAALVVFAWINLGIVNAYGSGAFLRFELERMPSRDLAQSLAWALYAIGLLVLGTASRRSALRWLSLGFQVLTLGKVFFYDLGELAGLYRVASMMGLAVCLLGVSLLYQRFVFRRPARA